MGNGGSKDFALDEKVDTTSRNVWTLHKSKSSDGYAVSVFVYDLTAPQCKPSFVENAAKYLKILRHPCVVKFHAVTRTSGEAWLITEHVTPLETILDSLTADEICAGLHNLVESLSFLHDRGGLCHNNVSLSSVFVAEDGTWKLGAMECVCRSSETSSAFLIECHSIRSERAIAPEEKEGKFDPSCGFSRDAYAFGMFAEYIVEYIAELGDRIKSFQKTIQDDFLNVLPKLRPKLSSLLDNDLFRNDFIEIVDFLKQITIKNEEEKNKFFRVIVKKLYRMPQELIARRLVKLLLSRFVVLDREACEHLIPHLLCPATAIDRSKEYDEGRTNPILVEPLFRRYVIPELFKIFHVRDVHIRTILLRHFHQYVKLFDQTSLADVVFPQILLSVRDANDELVMLSLNAISQLVPILGADVIVGTERSRIFYEGIPKFSAVNGHVSILANGSQRRIREANHMTTSDVITKKKSLDRGLSVDEKRKLKRAEVERRAEERKKKREETKKQTTQHFSRRSDDAEDVDKRENGSNETLDEESTPVEEIFRGEEDDGEADRGVKEGGKADRGVKEDDEGSEADYSDGEAGEQTVVAGGRQTKKTISYERTDSEIELEIETELRAMEISSSSANADLNAINNDPSKTRLVWSRVESGVGTAAESKKLSVRVSEIRKIDANDGWNETGWDDFDDDVPKKNAAFVVTGFSSPSSPPPNPSSTRMKPARISKRPSYEEPLGAGYDVMLIDVKTKTTTEEVYDFFADMAPDIKPSGNSLMSILTGGRHGTGKRGLSQLSAVDDDQLSGRLMKPNEDKHSFSVLNISNNDEQETGGWDEDFELTTTTS